MRPGKIPRLKPEPPRGFIQLRLEPLRAGQQLVEARAHFAAEHRHVVGVDQRRRVRKSEQRLYPRLRSAPLAHGGQGDFPHDHGIWQFTEPGCRHRAGAEREGMVRLLGPRADDEILCQTRQPQAQRLIQPRAQFRDRDGLARFARLPLGKVPPPMVAELEARLVHFAQLEWVRDLPRELADGGIIYHDARLRRGQRVLDHLEHFRDVGFGEPGFILERGMPGILKFKRLREQTIQGVAEIGGDWRAQLQIAERLKMFAAGKLVGRVKVRRLRLAQPVQRLELRAELVVELVALILQERFRRRLVLLGEVRHERFEAVLGKNVLQTHQRPDGLLRLVIQKTRQPAEGPLGGGVDGAKRIEPVEVLVEVVAVAVKGIVDHELPVLAARLQLVVADLANVAEANLRLTIGATPPKCVTKEKFLMLRHPQRLEHQHLQPRHLVAVVIHRFGAFENRLQIHARDRDGNRLGATHAFPELEQAAVRRPFLALPEHLLRFLSRDERLDRAVVQRRQPLWRHGFERLHFRHECGEEQRLDEPVVVAQRRAPGLGNRQRRRRLEAHPVLRFQHRLELLLIQFLGLIEVSLHPRAEGVVALGDEIKQIADRNDLPQLQRVALSGEELHHHLDGRALALEQRRNRDERFHERGAERIQLPKIVGIALGRQQHPHHFLAEVFRLREGLINLRARGFRLRFENALLGDDREIAVLQLDGVEAPLPVTQHIHESQLLRARDVLPDEVAQVALPGDETDDRHRPVRVLRLDQLRQLLRFAAHEIHVRRVTRQPENEFVQEENQRIETQRLRVRAHDRETIVDAHKFRGRAHRREVRLHEITHQPPPLLLGRSRLARLLERSRIPLRAKFAPAAAAATRAGFALVELRKKLLLAHARALLLRIREQRVGVKERRIGRLGEVLLHVIRVALENCRLEVLRRNEVERHHQEFLPGQPLVVLRHHVAQLLERARVRVPGQQEIQHRHEVTFARAKTPVQIRRLAGALQRGLHQLQRRIKTRGELRRHHVAGEGRLDLRRVGALRELQHEVALRNELRDGDQVFEQRGHKNLSSGSSFATR